MSWDYGIYELYATKYMDRTYFTLCNLVVSWPWKTQRMTTTCCYYATATQAQNNSHEFYVRFSRISRKKREFFSRKINSWVLRDFCVTFAWLLRDFCVTLAWIILREFCVSFAWLFREFSVTFVNFVSFFREFFSAALKRLLGYSAFDAATMTRSPTYMILSHLLYWI